jgi:SSS family solute:Na+ symporter/sodium/proline symporter
LTFPGALAGVLVGAVTVLLCILPLMPGGESFSEAVVYAMVPGFLLSFAATWLVSLATRPSAAAVERFDESRAAMAAAR